MDIISDMLAIVQEKGGSIKPTHLLYKSNLSYKKMLEYVKELMDKGMVGEKEEKGKKMYIITEKGSAYIQEFRKIKEFSDSFGL